MYASTSQWHIPSETGKPNISYHMKAPNLHKFSVNFEKITIQQAHSCTQFFEEHPPTQSNITWVKLANFLQRLKDIISFISDFGTSEGSEEGQIHIPKNFLFDNWFLKKILQGFYPKGLLFRKSQICQYIKIWLFGVKANNDEPSEYLPICMPSERELSCLLDLNLFVCFFNFFLKFIFFIWVQELGLGWGYILYHRD